MVVEGVKEWEAGKTAATACKRDEIGEREEDKEKKKGDVQKGRRPRRRVASSPGTSKRRATRRSTRRLPPALIPVGAGAAAAWAQGRSFPNRCVSMETFLSLPPLPPSCYLSFPVRSFLPPFFLTVSLPRDSAAAVSLYPASCVSLCPFFPCCCTFFREQFPLPLFRRHRAASFARSYTRRCLASSRRANSRSFPCYIPPRWLEGLGARGAGTGVR